MNHIPDELLVEIFDIYRPNYTPFPPAVSRAADEETLLPWWYTLIRVCRRWYRVVRHAKCRLNLALRCTRHALLGEMLLFAPLEFPVFLDFRWLAHGYVRRKDANGVARILQHPERLRGVALDAYPLTLSNMLASMVRPVPQLETLHLRKIGSKAATSHFPSNFLGGSAPKLTSLSLSGIAPLGPASWNWLASATSLTSLDLARVEYTLERVKVCLRGMPLLERLSLDFVDPAPPVFTSPCHNSDTERVKLPKLQVLIFFGTEAYLEGLLEWIRSPPLKEFRVKCSTEDPIATPSTTPAYMPRLLGSVNKTNTLPADTIRIQVLHEGHFHIDAGPGDSAWMVERTMLSSHADALGFGATVCSALAAALAETTTLCLRLDPRGTAPRSLDVQAWWGLLQHFRNVRVLCVATGSEALISQLLFQSIPRGEVVPALRTIKVIHERGDSRGPNTSFRKLMAPFNAYREITERDAVSVVVEKVASCWWR